MQSRSKSSTFVVLNALMWTITFRPGQVYSLSAVTRTAWSKNLRPFSSSFQRLPILASTLQDGIDDSVATTSDSKKKSSSTSSSLLPRVILKRNQQSKSFRDGNQLVFSGSILKTIGRVEMASLVQVEVPVSSDNNNTQTQLLGWGVYNPNSMYRVRLLCHSLIRPKFSSDMKKSSNAQNPNDCLEQILSSGFEKALQTRQIMGLPSTDTDTYRLVNGEGDGISGLAVDIIGDKIAVIMSSAAWCQVHRSTIMTTLQRVIPQHELIWKTTPSRLRQDGYEIVDDNDDNDEAEVEGQPIIGLENGIQYQTFPNLKGQKTSVYCDQRENRRNLAQLSKGKRFLDLCCYHGGFALNAARAGAARVVAIDSSQDAIDTSMSNAEMNGLHDIEFIKSDISEFMQSCDEKFDMIVLDPPKLAPSVSGLAKASRKYHSLNRDALKLFSEEGGLFMTCTCSAAMTQKDGGNYFLQMVQQASLAAQREITLLRVSGAAPCHTQSPASFPAGNYLTAALFYVHRRE